MAGTDRQGRGEANPLIQQDNWAGGINSAAQAEEIRNDQAQDIENFEYNADDNLISRVGIQTWLAATYPTRITSIHRYVDNNGTVRILYTTANKLFRANEAGGGITEITGGLTLPNDTIWQWKTFNGQAIGVNLGTGANANPVRVDNTGTAAALGGSPPKARAIEVWNNRLWLVSATNSNELWGSAIGNPADWTTPGPAGRIILNVDAGDGDQILALVAFRNSLFCLKRKKIHIISTIGTPVGDPENIRQDIFTSNIGVYSPYSVFPVLNDVLYYSDAGVASLVQSEFGELKSTILSTDVAELTRLRKTTQDFPSMVLDDKNQYWVSIPASASPRNINETYVFHYDKIDQSVRRWTRYTGGVVGTAYAEKLNGDFKEYLIGWIDPADTNYTIVSYSPSSTEPVFNDKSEGYVRTIVTKAYSAEQLLLRKDWIRFGKGIRLLTPLLSLSVSYFLNNKEAFSDTYPFAFTLEEEGGVWDDAFWDVDDWASIATRDEYIWRKFKKSNRGRKGATVTFVFQNTLADQAYIMKYFAIEYKMLGHRKVKTK